MERVESEEKAQRDEVARLGQELEQMRVALEDAQTEIDALAQERDKLRDIATALDRSRADAEVAAANARRHAANTAVLISDALQQTESSEDLRRALEEASVLAEELQATNEQLTAANEELDQRVADRTAALAEAKAELERINEELRRRVEAEATARARAQADLFQMQKMEAIGQLSGGIAHDFNNLLMVILNGLDVLARSEEPSQRERALRRTQEASWRAAELTRRLLAFARRQALRPERVDLHQHIQALRELLSQGLRENIELRIELAADLWPLEADAGALELTLLNLAVNARDAMPQGGMLKISARNRGIVEQELNGSVTAGDYVQIAVMDSGIGIAPELLDRVFEPFFTTKAAGEGTGLGLPQVYGFVQQSGGTVWVESQTGSGTTVHMLLPRSTRRIEHDVPTPPSARKTHSDLYVLVVEDEPAVASVVLDMLARLGHRATSVSTVAAALAVLANREPVDLVLTDVLLPGGSSGLDLARELRQRWVDLPIILTSGYGGSMTKRLSTMDLAFLHKPYELETLSRTIAVALHRSA